MLRRSSDSENSGDYNLRRLWERLSKKAHRRFARVWLHPLSSDRLSHEALVVPDQPTRQSDPIVMTSNPTNQSLEDQFLRWRQYMETKQEEQARQMAELQSRVDQLQQENNRLRTRLEGEWAGNVRGSNHPAPPVKQNKGKEPIQSEDTDAAANDELSSGSSPLPDTLPPKNNVEAESRKRPPRRSRRSVSGMPRRVRMEFSKERHQTERAPEHIPAWLRGTAPPLPFGYPAFEMASIPFMPVPTAVWGPQDMMSSPLGQHILSYEPPHGFTIPPFTIYDGSSDPYNHMMHFNQAMILSVGNDRLLCKVFPVSLKEPALA